MKNRLIMTALVAGVLGLGGFAIAQTATKPATQAAQVSRKPMRQMSLDEARAAVKAREAKVHERYEQLMKMTPAQWEEEKKKLPKRKGRQRRGRAGMGGNEVPAPLPAAK